MNDDETAATSIMEDSSWNHDDSEDDRDDDDEGSFIDRNSSFTTSPASPASPEDGSDSEGSRKSITFTTVTVREYPRCLGDNVTSNGAPISIEWLYDSEEEYDLVEYDEAAASVRREKHELQMPPELRFHLLVDELGYSRKDIQVAIRQNNVTKSQRQRTIETLDSNRGPVQGFLKDTKKKGNRLLKSIVMKPASGLVKRKSCSF